jgi:hypothetical protein
MDASEGRHNVAALLVHLRFGVTGEQITEFEVIDGCSPRVLFSPVSDVLLRRPAS